MTMASMRSCGGGILSAGLGSCCPSTQLPGNAAPKQVEQRDDRHRERGDGQHQLAGVAGDYVLRHREPDDDERELSAGTQQQRGLHRRRPRHAKQPQQPRQNPRLDNDEADDAGDDRKRIGEKTANVETHADREKEHAEQEPLEGLNRGLDGPMVLGLGQQQSRNEGAERHRQTGRGRRQPTAHGDEQHRRHEQLGAVHGGHEPEQRAQDDCADQHDRSDHEDRLPERLQ